MSGDGPKGLDNGPWRLGTELNSYPTVADFTAEPVLDAFERFGVQMRWVSPELGILTVFPWWDHFERSGHRMDEDDWSRPWTEAEPFLDADQNFAIVMWAVDDHVYIHSGVGFDVLSWYRAPLGRFEAEISRFREIAESGDIRGH